MVGSFGRRGRRHVDGAMVLVLEMVIMRISLRRAAGLLTSTSLLAFELLLAGYPSLQRGIGSSSSPLATPGLLRSSFARSTAICHCALL